MKASPIIAVLTTALTLGMTAASSAKDHGHRCNVCKRIAQLAKTASRHEALDDFYLGIEGSWEAGKDGARPGFAMPANPQVGDTYRQEFLLGDAEDAGDVLSLNETVEIDYGNFNNCLQTADYTPLEPDGLEHKYYAPGLGFILEIKPETGETVELIEVSTE